MPRHLLSSCLMTLLMTSLACTGCSFGEAPYAYPYKGRLILSSGQPAEPGTPVLFSTQGDLEQASPTFPGIEKFYEEQSRDGVQQLFGHTDALGQFDGTYLTGLAWGYAILFTGIVQTPTPPMFDAGYLYVRRAETWQKIPLRLTPDQQKYIDGFRSERHIDLGDVILPGP